MANQLLMHAVSEGDVDQAQTLIVEGSADVNCINTLGETPTHYAAMRGGVTMLELLLGFGADPNVPTKPEFGGATPILLATKLNHVQIVQTLLRHNADPNIPDSQGFTPLHVAAREGREDVAKLLVSHGSNLEAPDRMGKTPYFWAKENNHREIMALLPAFKYDWSTELKRLRDSFSAIDRRPPDQKLPKVKPKGKGKGK
eukprot:TRINITY_DN42526_c0_g1_i1.p1 TRINITY_DN42526_c0_g1~~TRINITY_DN42526_c0_g1_i1.p1  ORF type:complete len:200 (+),score=27.03 TRINITY_DN42526_c0_g1_i1:110-709(+)